MLTRKLSCKNNQVVRIAHRRTGLTATNWFFSNKAGCPWKPFTNSSIIPNITTRKVFEHIQPPYFEQINSTLNNSDADCLGCHDKSKVIFQDYGFSLAAKVSHYASSTYLVNPSAILFPGIGCLSYMAMILLPD